MFPDHPDNRRQLRRARIPSPSFWLLRPDEHVGLAGDRVSAGAVAAYLERIGVRNAAVTRGVSPPAV
jgi:hypothetical protein